MVDNATNTIAEHMTALTEKCSAMRASSPNSPISVSSCKFLTVTVQNAIREVCDAELAELVRIRVDKDSCLDARQVCIPLLSLFVS